MKTTATMYVTEDNGGIGILFFYDEEWYYCDCAPYDCWGDVDLHEMIEIEENGITYSECITLEALVEKLRAQNAEYADYCSEDFTNEQIGMKIPEYSGMSVEEIQEMEDEVILLVGDVDVAVD